MDFEQELKKFELSSVFTINFSWLKRYVESDSGMYTPIKSISADEFREIESSFYALQAAWKAWREAKSQAVPEWISTSERMPEEGEEVLVHSLGQVRQVTRDSKWAGGFKERNCYGWQAAYSQSHWMPKSIELPEQYHFYYENDAKQKAMIEAQEPAND